MQRRSFLAWLGLAPAAAVAPAPAIARGGLYRGAGLAPYLIGEAIHASPMIEGEALAPMASQAMSLTIDARQVRHAVQAEMRRAGLGIADGDEMQLTEGAGI